MNKLLADIAFFPPVEFFALLARYPSVHLEAWSHYEKQSWRNRCRILCAGVPEDLTVPVIHGDDLFHTPVCRVKVDYDSTPWMHKTFKTISTAYDSSPFFIYYKDELFSLLESRPETLWELDMEIIRFFCRKVGLLADVQPTVEFFTPQQLASLPDSGGVDDYRGRLHPKRPCTVLADLGLEGRKYWQGDGTQAFVGGLSIMDLLFNEGPESICFLK
ncbi:MAG: WbqC family protein [Bacteroidales bacterium]|nr:WbqC family protein [Bacteroidales bacterium]